MRRPSSLQTAQRRFPHSRPTPPPQLVQPRPCARDRAAQVHRQVGEVAAQHGAAPIDGKVEQFLVLGRGPARRPLDGLDVAVSVESLPVRRAVTAPPLWLRAAGILAFQRSHGRRSLRQLKRAVPAKPVVVGGAEPLGRARHAGRPACRTRRPCTPSLVRPRQARQRRPWCVPTSGTPLASGPVNPVTVGTRPARDPRLNLSGRPADGTRPDTDGQREPALAHLAIEAGAPEAHTSLHLAPRQQSINLSHAAIVRRVPLRLHP